MRDLIKIFKALSDKNRLTILKLLEVRPLCVCEITEILQLATSTVSKHLSILRDAGFIDDRKDGKWVYYEHKQKNVDERVQYLMEKLPEWLDQYEESEELLQKAKKINKDFICPTS